MTEIISCNSNIYWYIINVFHKISLRFHWDFSFLWFWPKVPYLTWFSVLTFLDQSSNSSWVFNFCLKLSPSAFSLCPSTWFSQPFPRTSSTRLMYADSWRSIWSRKLIDFYNYVLWLSSLCCLKTTPPPKLHCKRKVLTNSAEHSHKVVQTKCTLKFIFFNNNNISREK